MFQIGLPTPIQDHGFLPDDVNDNYESFVWSEWGLGDTQQQQHGVRLFTLIVCFLGYDFSTNRLSRASPLQFPLKPRLCSCRRWWWTSSSKAIVCLNWRRYQHRRTAPWSSLCIKSIFFSALRAPYYKFLNAWPGCIWKVTFHILKWWMHIFRYNKR